MENLFIEQLRQPGRIMGLGLVTGNASGGEPPIFFDIAGAAGIGLDRP
jgi:hypothetical protein